MLQRLIAAVLGVLGLIAIGLGIASATVWRGDDTLTATARAADGTTLMTTAPGILELNGRPVTIRATADDGAKVVLAIGRDTDVAGWVGTDAHTVVTGLRDWHTLTTDDVASSTATTNEGDASADEAPAEEAPPAEVPAEEVPAEEAPAPTTPAPDPDGSDLWVEQTTGEGSAEMIWEPRDGRWTLLVAVAGEGAGPPTVELSWPRTVTTPWLVPGVVGGAVLLLLALLLAVRARRTRRREDDRHPATTGATPVVGGEDASESAADAQTRRQRREVAAAPASDPASAPAPDDTTQTAHVDPAPDAPGPDGPATGPGSSRDDDPTDGEDR